MTDRDEPMLLLGSYGRGNIGDDAFLLAALQLFKGRKLYVNSADDGLLPKDVRGKVTTIATTGSKDLKHKLRIFGSIRHIVYCGGDLWVELYGDRFPRQSLYKMVIVNAITRLCGKKVHYLGCGIGALRGYSLFLARLSARLANSIVVREPRSAAILDLAKVQVLPDLVTTLDIGSTASPSPAVRRPEATGSTLSLRDRSSRAGPGTLAGEGEAVEPDKTRGSDKYTIGVSILYHLPDPERNFPMLIATLATVLGKLPTERYRIVLFPMLASPSEDRDDVWASAELEQLLADSDVTIFTGREVEDYVAALADVDLLIGARLHANIIAMLAGVPTPGISYRPKVRQFFVMNGLEQYSIDLDDLTPEILEKLVKDIHTRREQVVSDFTDARERLITARGGYTDFAAAHF